MTVPVFLAERGGSRLNSAAQGRPTRRPKARASNRTSRAGRRRLVHCSKKQRPTAAWLGVRRVSPSQAQRRTSHSWTHDDRSWGALCFPSERPCRPAAPYRCGAVVLGPAADESCASGPASSKGSPRNRSLRRVRADSVKAMPQTPPPVKDRPLPGDAVAGPLRRRRNAGSPHQAKPRIDRGGPHWVQAQTTSSQM